MFSIILLFYIYIFSGKTEIVNACARLARRVRARELSMNNLTEDLFHQQFYDERAPSDLNLIIRSSGHNRLSDFVTMQVMFDVFISNFVYF